MNLRTLLFTGLSMMTFPAITALAGNVVKQEINQGWTFRQVRGNNWYPATVPGVVHTDLMHNQLIEDPFFRLNERSVQWIDKEDWEYKTTLHVSAGLFGKEHIELDFKGLDTYADVFLNDSCILKANNMFREWRVDVKSLLKQGDNALRVRFRSPVREDLPKFDAIHYPIEAGNDQSENGGILDKKLSVFARKAGYHYGWDWGPRLVTSGIWRPVYLMAWEDARIENVHYIQESVTAKQAKVKARVELIAGKEGEARLQIKAGGVKDVWETNARVKEGLNLIEVDFVIRNPKRWWSNGLGEPHLYPFTATVSIAGQTVDSRTDRIGLRELKLIREKDAAGQTFYFQLNGVNVFAKGANYIPQDNFLPRVTAERHEKTILDAVHAHMNMLRVWGGGIYEDDLFYDLCDQYGILVWQDFMFACSTYPMNPGMLDNIRQEATDNVRRLRNHPCIALWCGNNENHTAWFNWGWMPKYRQLGVLDEMRKDYKDLFHGVLPEVVTACDPTAFYWPSSPYAGDPDAPAESGKANWNPNGDGHYWGVWHGKDSIANFNVIRARFFSEYGFQSFPEYQSVLQYAPETRDQDIFSEVMMAHQRGGSNANALIEWYLLNEYRKPKDFPNFLYMGQLLQGDAIRTAIEAHRRDMPYCMGSLFWQHNDCWPVASWSSRDFYGRWKAQHYFAKKAYDNILVSPLAKDHTLEVHIVSDYTQAVKGALHVRVMDLKGNLLFGKNTKVTLPANSSHVQFSAPLETILKGRSRNEVVVNARFTTADGKVPETTYTNNYFLSRYKDIDFPKATIRKTLVASGDGFDVTLESDVFARGVFLSIEGIDNFFSDNYFDILPGEPVTIHVSTSLDKASFERQLKSESISDAY
ncbi:MAG: glycoside hydrolase family 2 protein [Tannerellaceae bacterium]|jgi:beta-mannosidase|nr:glycoside hydrolase family 2 protein [Tannerellaceae bacterium]